MDKEPELFFILGRERSGTTLLQSFLNAHPDIHIPNESPFIRHLYRTYRYETNWNQDKVLGFYEDLLGEPYFRQWSIDREALKSNLLKLAQPDFHSCCIEVLKSGTPDNKTISHFGDKNPQYSLIPEKLLDAFPNAKFICLIRDYRAQVNSMRRVKLETGNIAALANRWVHFSKKLTDFNSNHPNQSLLINYESLVKDPHKVLSNLCEFLKVPYKDEMIEKRTVQVASDEFYSSEHHISVKQEVSEEKISEWKEELSKSQIRLLDTICGEQGKQLGYEPEYPKNVLSWVFSIPGQLYGKAYFSFLKWIYSLPIGLRAWVFKKLIYPNFAFWQENLKDDKS